MYLKYKLLTYVCSDFKLNKLYVSGTKGRINMACSSQIRMGLQPSAFNTQSHLSVLLNKQHWFSPKSNQ